MSLTLVETIEKTKITKETKPGHRNNQKTFGNNEKQKKRSGRDGPSAEPAQARPSLPDLWFFFLLVPMVFWLFLWPGLVSLVILVFLYGLLSL